MCLREEWTVYGSRGWPCPGLFYLMSFSWDNKIIKCTSLCWKVVGTYRLMLKNTFKGCSTYALSGIYEGSYEKGRRQLFTLLTHLSHYHFMHLGIWQIRCNHLCVLTIGHSHQLANQSTKCITFWLYSICWWHLISNEQALFMHTFVSSVYSRSPGLRFWDNFAPESATASLNWRCWWWEPSFVS